MNVILGTMQFGERVFGSEATRMLSIFREKGHTELDTAFVYNEGESERLIGKGIKELKKSFRIATKVNPRISGRLDGEAVHFQFSESLKRLETDSVDLLYLHFPDLNTDLHLPLEACDRLYREGKIGELGLSNFPAWFVAEAYHICKSEGWLLPTVYEGLYNPLSRHAEKELDRALSYYKLRYNAYNPLAGGLLTNKYLDQNIKEGRFVNRPNYQKRYWHESYFAAIGQIRAVCDKHGLTVTEAAFRWLCHHSMLKAERGDGIIIGASGPEQLEQNLTYLAKDPLPHEVEDVIRNAWELSKADAPEYFTLFTKQK